MSAELFLEIGTEEIPAGFLPPAMADLERLMRKELEAGRIGFETVRTFATPRRLVLAVKGVALEQARQEITAAGPSVSVAFDAAGADFHDCHSVTDHVGVDDAGDCFVGHHVVLLVTVRGRNGFLPVPRGSVIHER